MFRHSLLILLPLALAACSVQIPLSSNPPTQVPPPVRVQESTVDRDYPLPGGVSSNTLESLTSIGGLRIGVENAPLTILVFTNYGCEYCRAFDVLLQQLRTDSELGKSISEHIVPINLRKYPKSDTLGKELVCAAMQGKGLLLHGALFSVKGSAELLSTDLGGMGIDVTTFNTCLTSERTTALRTAANDLASALNVSLVPTYFINGERFTGLPEWSEFEAQVRRALKEAE